jgi:hypothetical protein
MIERSLLTFLAIPIAENSWAKEPGLGGSLEHPSARANAIERLLSLVLCPRKGYLTRMAGPELWNSGTVVCGGRTLYPFGRDIMSRVYVLNNSYECVSQTTHARAWLLIDQGKAEVVKWSGKALRYARGEFKIPLIIRIFRYVKAFGRTLRYCNRFVWERDAYHCQYCGKKITSKSDLQTDHVMPQSRGGKTSYDNMVTACSSCNSRKDNKTPEEAKMKLLKHPYSPHMSKSMADIAAEVKRILAQEGWM